ncbi:MAG: DUF3810 family protein [Saprospiraceae bacterium]|nr:DUF3810 family protein [Saprospiraceae bacterium]MBL0082620.1 DUF3810 family protein [Saprospiraceae bacterium]
MKRLFPVWILFLGVVVLIKSINDNWLEHIYHPWIFQPLRRIYEITFYHLPFAVIYLVIPIFIWLVFRYYKWVINRGKTLLLKLSFTITVVMIVFIWFYSSWGLLYKSKPLQIKLNMSDVPIDTLYLRKQLQWTETQLLHVRQKFWKDDSRAIPIEKMPSNLEFLLQKEVAATLNNWGIRSNKKVRVRPLYPAGSLLIFSTAGIYLPFSMEGHYDPGLAHFHSPFVMAHELSHGYGITGEADCNFVAMISCLRSEEPFIQYAGLLTYWRYLASDLKKSAKYSYYQMAFLRPIPIRKDLFVLYEALDQYPEIMPMIRDIIYDSYLKANGLTDGLKNYDKIIHLIRAWQMSSLDKNIKSKWGMDSSLQ